MASINPLTPGYLGMSKALLTQANGLQKDGVPTEAYNAFVEQSLQHEVFQKAPDPLQAGFNQRIVHLSKLTDSPELKQNLLRGALLVIEKGFPGTLGVALAKVADLAIRTAPATSDDKADLAFRAINEVRFEGGEDAALQATLLQDTIGNQSLPQSVRDSVARNGLTTLASMEGWNVV